MFRASARDYDNELAKGDLYPETQRRQMTAQSITWNEAADSLENMYLIDSSKSHLENFERDLDDILSLHEDRLGLCESVGVLEATKLRLLQIVLNG